MSKRWPFTPLARLPEKIGWKPSFADVDETSTVRSLTPASTPPMPEVSSSNSSVRIVAASGSSKTKDCGLPSPTQFWIDPYGLDAADLGNSVAPVRPLRKGLILGGTKVHDWFHMQRAMDRVHLTVEPIFFGSGLPIFSGLSTVDPVAAFRRAGYYPVSERVLNGAGTRFLVLEPRDLMAATRARRKPGAGE